MSFRVKCRECMGCMIPVWVGTTRYWHCDFCKTYYGGMDKELVLVKDPFSKLNKPVDIEKDDLHETES